MHATLGFSGKMVSIMAAERKRKDLLGMRFGRWLVAGRAAYRGESAVWFCSCDCGAKKEVFQTSLVRGMSKSCGCLSKEKAAALKETHGRSFTVEYRCWSNMKQRCLNPKNKDYSSYGGRGITVCKEWAESFESFFKDMGECPEGFTIERSDNERSYEPGNCLWISKKDQADNKRTTDRIVYKGIEMTRLKLSALTGFNYSQIRNLMSSRPDDWETVLNEKIKELDTQGYKAILNPRYHGLWRRLGA